MPASSSGVQLTTEQQQQQQQQTDPNRPAWLDAKFSKPEDLATAYAEAQKKISELTAGGSTTPTPTATIPQDAIAQAGLDMKTLSKEYNDNGGKLTETTLKALEAKGISRAAVDTHIKGAQAVAQQIVGDVIKSVGGEQQLKALYSWAQAELSPVDLAAYNEVIDSGNRAAASLAVQGLLSRYTGATGREAVLVTGEGQATTSGAQPFQSSAEIVAMMSDQRYKNGDTAYIKSVEARMAVTGGFIKTLDNGRRQ